MNMHNTSVEGIEANKLTLKKILFDNQVPTPEKLVGKRTQEYQQDPTPERKEALEQAAAIAEAVNNSKGLAGLYQGANTGEKLLGPELAPNTIPKPNLNPTAGLPTGGPGLTPPPAQGPVASVQVPTPKSAAAPSGLPPGIPPGSVRDGFADDGSHAPLWKAPNGKRYKG
jgi:hypothetical protein